MNSVEPKKSHFGHFFLFFSLIFNFCLHFFFSQNLPILTEHDVSSHIISVREREFGCCCCAESISYISGKSKIWALFSSSLSRSLISFFVSTLLQRRPSSQRREKVCSKLMNGFKVKFLEKFSVFAFLHFCENSPHNLYILLQSLNRKVWRKTHTIVIWRESQHTSRSMDQEHWRIRYEWRNVDASLRKST